VSKLKANSRDLISNVQGKKNNPNLTGSEVLKSIIDLLTNISSQGILASNNQPSSNPFNIGTQANLDTNELTVYFEYTPAPQNIELDLKISSNREINTEVKQHFARTALFDLNPQPDYYKTWRILNPPFTSMKEFNDSGKLTTLDDYLIKGQQK